MLFRSITSSICFLLNDLPSHNSLDMDAIYGRAKTVFFVPSVYEVHEYVMAWWPRTNPDHADITDFIGENLRRITRPSIRWYTDAIREKSAGEDWRHWLMVQWENADPLLSIIADIRDAGLQTEVQVLAEWKRRTRGYKGHEHGLGSRRKGFSIFRPDWSRRNRSRTRSLSRKTCSWLCSPVHGSWRWTGRICGAEKRELVN